MDDVTSGTATPSYTPASVMDNPLYLYLYYPWHYDPDPSFDQFPIDGPGGDEFASVTAGSDYIPGTDGGVGTPVLGSVATPLSIALSANLKYVYYDADGHPATPPAKYSAMASVPREPFYNYSSPELDGAQATATYDLTFHDPIDNWQKVGGPNTPATEEQPEL